ncbi:MAG TPA: vanadium-dependent haloperoxidase [Bryobacteraceae bacterium]|nr:vanadium-dependent haloperoxidase [Bryobacteraceae bacterium]
MRKVLFAGLVCALLTLGAVPTAAQTDMVVRWNQNLLRILRTPGAHPGSIHPTRNFAIMHIAVYDAVNSIERSHTQFFAQLTPATANASQQAAAAAAAHRALTLLYPAQQSNLDNELNASLSGIPAGPDREEGVRIGQHFGTLMVALRSNDRSSLAAPPFVPGTGPGGYQITPPNTPNPVFTGWSNVIPFTISFPTRFRPGPPPSLTSAEYAAAFNEVKQLGGPTSTATFDQRITGWFWNAAIQNYWNEIAQTAVVSRGLTTAQSARLFALMNIAFADAAIAFYEAKYFYSFWRPVTAIRSAADDGNPDTDPDSTWLPSTRNTPPDPSYPGAHSVISAAGAEVLRQVLGTDAVTFSVSSEVFAGVVRSFTSFTAAANEAGLSRIFSGAHYRFDDTSGQQLGKGVAEFVVANFLRPAI